MRASEREEGGKQRQQKYTTVQYTNVE